MTDALLSIAAIEDSTSSGVYLKRDLTLVRGEGALLWDETGRRYIDCVGGQGAANFGHRHPVILQAMRRQMETLTVCPEMFHTPARALYQQALIEAAGPHFRRVVLCNSGAEANEAALKMARLVTGRHGVISTMRGFHGRTMGALSTTWEKAYREPFEPLIAGVTFVPYNNLERMAAAISDATAAVLVEAVQGEGGVHPAEPGYLAHVQALCRERGALLIVDEVQTGFGRTGALFAHHHDGVQPDLMPVAKSIAGGLLMGALLMSARVGAQSPAAHRSTIGGSPLACAAAQAALGVLRDDRLSERAALLGALALDVLRAGLRPTAFREVRGRGLLIGIELRGKVAPVLRAMQERGVLALPAGPTVLRLLPPLGIAEDDWNEALQQVLETLNRAAE